MSVYVASFPFKYCGRVLLSGQVLRNLDGAVGDHSLTGLQYLRETSKAVVKEAVKCDDCGREFISVRHLHDHRRRVLCLDEDGKLLPTASVLKRARDLRTDSAVISALPEDKRKELTG